MTVELYFTNSLETEVVEGDLISLVNNLNIAQANGKAFTILDGSQGPVMVQTKNINMAKELAEDPDALIGR